MKTIVAIVGASGSGKTQLTLYAKKLGYPVICSYTTRPMREGETNGVEHIFVTADKMPKKDKMLASGLYKMVFNEEDEAKEEFELLGFLL